jgi:plasmid stabilization system protein ParE
MPRIDFSPDSLEDLDRLQEFLQQKSPEAWEKARTIIKADIAGLSTRAGIHKPVDGRPHQYDLKIKFGAYGYTVRYRFERGGDVVVILKMKHNREQDFS